LDEYLQGLKDAETMVDCENCGHGLKRSTDRAYYAERIAIRGDTCAGCDDQSNYYDDGLGEFVKSRTHRKDIMKRKGLTEYAPDPKVQRHLDEQTYIMKSIDKTDPSAVNAARSEGKKADKVRKTRAVADAIKKGRAKFLQT
jgi:hypothetical protein